MDRREDKATTLEVEIPRMDIVIKIPPQEFVTYSNYATACGMTIQEFICYVLEYAGDHKEQIYAYIDARKSYHKNPSEGKASGS